MSGHGEKLERMQEQAIAALLACKTIPEAARTIGVGDSTLWRWLQEPSFSEEYRLARRQTMSHAISQVQAAATEAVCALREIMSDANAPASSRVSAAKAILETAVKAVEIEDISDRLQKLEEIADMNLDRKVA